MTANNQTLQRVNERGWLRGFSNLLRKENQVWWGTRRWWINALLWPAMLGGLVSVMLFMLPSVAAATGDPGVAAAGGPIPFAMQMGRTVFFEMGTLALALGVIVLSQDLIVDEKQSGLTEWMLAKPVARRAYVLAKLAAATLAVLVLLIALPAIMSYLLLTARTGTPFPLIPFLGGLGIMTAHTFFYLTLTLMLGTFFDNRAPILGIALGSVMGGTLIGGIVQPLNYVTPWMLGKTASLVADSQPLPAGILWVPLAASLLWSGVFIIVALVKFEKTEF
jgi:ABC-type transport system involved in multi-copper enzyme maturation permease subunit